MQLTVILNVRHIAGPDHLDCSHVATWLESRVGVLMSDLMVCADHADPINCDCDKSVYNIRMALYRLMVERVVAPMSA